MTLVFTRAGRTSCVRTLLLLGPALALAACGSDRLTSSASPATESTGPVAPLPASFSSSFRGGIPFARVDNRMSSWSEVRPFRTLRFEQDLEELARRRERERELNKVLPAATEYPAFLSSVQAVASSSGISLTAWTPQNVKAITPGFRLQTLEFRERFILTQVNTPATRFPFRSAVAKP
jgi:hypothetical protein